MLQAVTAKDEIDIALGQKHRVATLLHVDGNRARKRPCTATNIEGHQSNRNHSESFQNDRGVWMRQERCSFRVSDATTELTQGDQLSDPGSIYWAVVGVASTGVGTRRYDLSRDVPLYAEGSSRNGGV